MKFEIRYYMSEGAKNCNIPAFKETLNGSKEVALHIAEVRLKGNKNFKSYEIIKL